MKTILNVNVNVKKVPQRRCDLQHDTHSREEGRFKRKKISEVRL